MRAIGIDAISYVGTTLLSVILGSHPSCRSVGHVYQFFPPFKGIRLEVTQKDNVCSICSLLEKDCSLNYLKYVGETSREPYDIIRHLVLDHEDIIIDSSSTSAWFQLSVPDDIVWMFRDPISLASSYVKHMSVPRDKAIDYMCLHYNKKYRNAGNIAIEYKNIVKETEFLVGLFTCLGLEFDPSFLDYWNYDNHMVGGNHGVLVNYAKNRVPQKLDEVIGLASRGNDAYAEHYRRGFSGNVNLLTDKEERVVLKKCLKTYSYLRAKQDRLLSG